jgi:hypothetical protein
VKYQTFAYSASQRSGIAVYIHGLYHQSTATGLIVASGRTAYLQRNLGGAWQTVLGRTVPANGRITVGFIQLRTYSYRWIVIEAPAAWGASSAITTR